MVLMKTCVFDATGQLTKVLTMIRQEICVRAKKPSSSCGEKLTSKLNKLIKDHLSEFNTRFSYTVI